MDFLTINLIFYILAYLVGSIPFGLVLAKAFAKVDITQLGSNNIGATNVMRVVKAQNPTLAKKLSVATFLLDALKGVLLVVAASAFDLGENALWTIAWLSLMGHCYSAYLSFEGGKGISTFFGLMLLFYPLWALGALVVWVVVYKIFKRSSLSGLTATTLTVFGIYAATASGAIAPNAIGSLTPLFVMYFIVIYKHGDNIYRLLTGQEGKVA